MQFAPGLNVITGPSDQGKSAIIRALRWVLFNEPRGTDFIRAGAGKALVSVWLDNGVMISRERSSSRNRYTLQYPGQEEMILEGFGSEVPLEVRQAHGIRKVMLDTDTEVVLNIAGQLEGPFLLNVSGATRAKAIGRVYGVHLLDAAVRSCLRDTARLEQRLHEIDARLATNQAQLQEYQDLPLLEARLGQVTTLTAAAKEKQERAVRLRQYAGELAGVRQAIASTKSLLATVEAVEGVVPLLESLERLRERHRALAQRADELARVNRHLEQLRELVARLTDVEGASALVEQGRVTIAAYNRLCQEAAQLASCRRQLRVLQHVEELTAGLEQASAQYQELLILHERRAALSRLLPSWRAVTATVQQAASQLEATGTAQEAAACTEEALMLLPRYRELAALATRLRQIQAQYSQAARAARQAQEQYGAGMREYCRVLEEMGRCPVCRQPIDAATVARIVREMEGEINGL